MAFNDNDKNMAEKAEKRMAQALATSKVAADTYVDQSQEVTLTKGDINRMAFRSLALQASFNYERMQAGGWLFTILPALRKIHRNKNDLKNAMHMHMEFINVHPFDVTFLSGLVLAMEKGKENISTIRAVKVALMGPLGGIGDALFWLTLLPISLLRRWLMVKWFTNQICLGVNMYLIASKIGYLKLKKRAKRYSHLQFII